MPGALRAIMVARDEERTRGLLGHPTTPLVLGAGAASLKRGLPAPAAVKSEGSLGMNLLGDMIAAFGASVGVAPFITIADWAIMQVKLSLRGHHQPPAVFVPGRGGTLLSCYFPALDYRIEIHARDWTTGCDSCTYNNKECYE